MVIIERNNIELIGKITSLSNTQKDIKDNEFMFFDIVQNEYAKDKNFCSSFYKIRLNRTLIDKYKELLVKGNNIYINGYLHSYKKETRNVYYVYPKELKLLDQNFKLKDNNSIIDYDTDGVMLWNGKRCESTPLSEEELKEMEDLLSQYR